MNATVIRPDLLAGKMESAGFEILAANVPGIPPGKLRELLWFIQAASMEKRGLDGLVEMLIANYPARFITPAMHDAGAPKDGRYTLAQCLEIWKEELSCAWQKGIYSLSDKELETLANRAIAAFNTDIEHKPIEPDSLGLRDWLHHCLDKRATVKAIERGVDYDKPAILNGVERFNYAYIHAQCVELAKTRLARLLRDWCIEKTTRFDSPAYCHDLPGLLIEHMEAFAAQRRKEIAQTEVTRIVFRELEFAISQNVPVPIIGESRIGKSKPASI